MLLLEVNTFLFRRPAFLQLLERCFLEPALGRAEAGRAVQFERLGYFCPDSKDDAPGSRVFNRTVTLRDSWAKLEKQAMAAEA